MSEPTPPPPAGSRTGVALKAGAPGAGPASVEAGRGPAVLAAAFGGALVRLAAAAVVAGLYLALLWAPTDVTLGHVQRIFYVHVATAWNAYLAFTVVLGASLAYLKTRRLAWDRVAAASAEVGVLFTTLVLLTGPIWARAVWGAWWTWDPRLTTTLILWFIYVGYLVLRSAVEEPERRARVAAVFGIIGFVDVPLVHFSVVWWRSIHPNIIGRGKLELEPTMLVALLVNVLAFSLIYLALLEARTRLEEHRAALEALRRRAEG